MERCDECGYDYAAVQRGEIASALRALAPQYRSWLEHDPVRLRTRPVRDVWSPLEYACHFRDVLRVQRGRIELALQEDQPAFASMRREERVLEERYNEQDPERVAGELTRAADELAAALERLDEDGWNRTGIYNWPTRAVRTVEWIARHTIHEGRHHLQDIEKGLKS